jgi:hypothetical protein
MFVLSFPLKTCAWTARFSSLQGLRLHPDKRKLRALDSANGQAPCLAIRALLFVRRLGGAFEKQEQKQRKAGFGYDNSGTERRAEPLRLMCQSIGIKLTDHRRPSPTTVS